VFKKLGVTEALANGLPVRSKARPSFGRPMVMAMLIG
jgi:hypothetical protein